MSTHGSVACLGQGGQEGVGEALTAEGLSVLTIARDLSLNPVTVKTRLFRARRRLRAALEVRLRGVFEAVFPFDGARCTGMADRVTGTLKEDGRL